MNKKYFNSENDANNFAKKVNGTVRMSVLPGYMSVDVVYVVEWRSIN